MRWITIEGTDGSFTFNRDNVTHIAESIIRDRYGNKTEERTVIYFIGGGCEVVKSSYIDVIGVLKAGE